MWYIIALLVWIGLCTKLRFYKVTPNRVRLSCQGFGYLCRAFMLSWIISSNNYLKVSHRKTVYVTSDIKLVTYLINFECRPCGIFEGFSCYQEDEAIAPTNITDTVGLEDKI